MLSPLNAAVILTAASGAEVPIATMVRPMINCGIPSLSAILLAPSTNQSAPLISSTNPATRNTVCSRTFATESPYMFSTIPTANNAILNNQLPTSFPTPLTAFCSLILLYLSAYAIYLKYNISLKIPISLRRNTQFQVLPGQYGR